MDEAKEVGARRVTSLKSKTELLEQYGCGPIRFSGTNDGLYERHLLFDDAVAPASAAPHERYRAVARSVRDVLSQRWVRTKATYEHENPKRVYYLSMEFLIGRSLANNITNLLLDPVVKRAAEQRDLDWVGLIEEEPDAGLGNGGLGRHAACFLDSMATMQLPAMGYGLRYEYGIFKQSIKDGWQVEEPDNWLRDQDPWEVRRPTESVDVKLNCSFSVHDGTLRAEAGRPSSVIGVPFDRPIVGYGGKTINTLRLWAAAAPDYFNFREFSSGDFVAALAGTLAAESLTRVLYPDDSTIVGQAPELAQFPKISQREAEQSINFVTCHDGFTLNDLVSFNGKHNEANGEGNRDGADHNLSWNCGIEGPTADPAVERLRNRQVKNFFTLTLLATGTPMLLMGDEVRRTQHGNNNAFCQNNEISWFDWTLVKKHADLHRFVRALIALRMNRDLPIERLDMTLNELLRRQPFQ